MRAPGVGGDVEVTTAGCFRSCVNRAANKRVDILGHDNPISGGGDQALQFRQLAALGTEVERLDIQQSVIDRNHQQIAPNDAGACLVPKRKLLGDGRILIDPGLNLCRTVNQFLLRKANSITLP